MYIPSAPFRASYCTYKNTYLPFITIITFIANHRKKFHHLNHIRIATMKLLNTLYSSFLSYLSGKRNDQLDKQTQCSGENDFLETVIESTPPKKSKRKRQSSSNHSVSMKSPVVRIENKYNSPMTSKLHSQLNKSSDGLSGGNHGDGIFGEFTSESLTNLLTMMEKHCGLNKKSTYFLDIGSGVGRVVQHVAPFVGMSVGIENVNSRHRVSSYSHHHIL